MSWIRLDDDYVHHPKFTILSDRAFRLWHEGMAYCRKTLSDGYIPLNGVKTFRYGKRRRVVTELLTPASDHTAPLWEQAEGGVLVHDYLQWNASKEEELENREYSRLRATLTRNPETRHALRARDGDQCRYCGETVNWQDRKGPLGATYDHVVPRGPDRLENLVVACRRCNGIKGNKPLSECGLTLRPVPDKSRQEIQIHQDKNLDLANKKRTGSSSEDPEGTNGAHLVSPAGSLEADVIAIRAGRLVEHYGELFILHRNGAKYKQRPNLDWIEACDLCRLWDDKRLEKLAVIVLQTDDPWIAGTDRGFKIFALKASWADSRLLEWAKEHGVTV